jgi:hypothetical protein
LRGNEEGTMTPTEPPARAGAARHGSVTEVPADVGDPDRSDMADLQDTDDRPRDDRAPGER